MWIVDLRIAGPQHFPSPGVAQKQCRDVPQRVARLDGIGQGYIGVQRQRLIILRHRAISRQQYSERTVADKSPGHRSA